MPRVTRSQAAALLQKASPQEDAQRQQHQREPFLEVDTNIAVEPTKPGPKARATRSRAKKVQKQDIETEYIQKENSDPETQCEPPVTEIPSGPAKVTVKIGEVDIAIEVAPAARTRSTRQAVASGETSIESISTASEQDTSAPTKKKSTASVATVKPTLPPTNAFDKPTAITTTKKIASTEIQVQPQELAALAVKTREGRTSRVLPPVSSKEPVVTTTRTAALLRAQQSAGKLSDEQVSRPKLKTASEGSSTAPAGTAPLQKRQTISPSKPVASSKAGKPITITVHEKREQESGASRPAAVRIRTDLVATEATSALHQPARRNTESQRAPAPRLAPDSRVHKLAEPKTSAASTRLSNAAATQRTDNTAAKPQSIRPALDIYEGPRKVAPSATSFSPRKDHVQGTRPPQAAVAVESSLQKMSTPKRLPTTISLSPSKRGVQDTVARLQAAISAETTSQSNIELQKNSTTNSLSPFKKGAQTPTSRHTIASASPFSRLATPRRPATGVSITPIKETTPVAKTAQKVTAAPSPLLKQTPKRPSYLPSPVKSNKPITTPVPFRFSAVGRADTPKESPKPTSSVQTVTPKMTKDIQKPSNATMRQPVFTPKPTAPTSSHIATTPKIATLVPAQPVSSPASKQPETAPKQPTTRDPVPSRSQLLERKMDWETKYGKQKPAPPFTDARTLLREARKDARKGTLPELKGAVEYAALPNLDSSDSNSSDSSSPKKKSVPNSTPGSSKKGSVPKSDSGSSQGPTPPAKKIGVDPVDWPICQRLMEKYPGCAGTFYCLPQADPTSIPVTWQALRGCHNITLQDMMIPGVNSSSGMTLKEIESEERRQNALRRLAPQLKAREETAYEMALRVHKTFVEHETPEVAERNKIRAEAVERGHQAVMEWALRPTPRSLLPYGVALPERPQWPTPTPPPAYGAPSPEKKS
ncbi:hypothetical protein ABW21_db0203186 [Orbilia brochopaga]|nr:hypothetical protein ABW21_db0203186 [Drechslerella brochopaga]